ncbi:MAG: hypothetical protein GX130_08505 [Candidatus Hydrogenedens sp.]|jgi:3',5'-cyclic AMP phosphodiesterase CpdA|nr:hypothetical protein [Candidatus Hydrogenedens sp.]
MNQRNVSRRQFFGATAATAASGFFVAQTATGAPATDFPGERVLTIPDKGIVRVLQFTDIHYFKGIDKYPVREEYLRHKTVGIMRRLVDHAQPDLIVSTGDFWHENPDGRGLEFMNWAIDSIVALGRPWTFTWGNHDHVGDEAEAHRTLEGALHSVYGGTARNGNHTVVIELENGKRVLELLCLNSGRRGVDKEALGYVTDYARARVHKEKVLRMSAFHIPLKQYHDRWVDGSARGLLGEKVYFEDDDGSALKVFQDAGVSAIFCGHDHESDYSAFSDGVELIYGRATGYNGYGAETLDKGGKLFEIDTVTGDYRWKSLFPDGTTWQPGKEEHLDIRED